MDKPHTTLDVGARGWQHRDWCGSYYPDDLPADWRLDYYANEFRQVLLPYADWCGVMPEEAAAWAEATDDSFRLFIELPDTPLTPTAVDTLAALGARLAGICAIGDEPGAEQTGLARLAPLYRQRPLAAVSPFAAGHQWLPQDAGVDIPRLVTAAGAPSPSALQLRGYIEALRASTTDNAETLIFVAGEPPAIADMRTLQALCELLAG